jgi:hypothetical protein
MTAPIQVLATAPPSGGSSVDPINASALFAKRIAITDCHKLDTVDRGDMIENEYQEYDPYEGDDCTAVG